jgi:ribosome-associated heat shock protein Hsp15
VDETSVPVRVDRWLWAARLVRTRALAAEAVKGGRVHLNGRAIRPSRDVRPGDRLEVTVGHVRREVVVRATAERRGPAREAQLLYEETDESREARERLAAQRRLAPAPAPAGGPRPTKRDRRRLEQHRRRG